MKIDGRPVKYYINPPSFGEERSCPTGSPAVYHKLQGVKEKKKHPTKRFGWGWLAETQRTRALPESFCSIQIEIYPFFCWQSKAKASGRPCACVICN